MPAIHKVVRLIWGGDLIIQYTTIIYVIQLYSFSPNPLTLLSYERVGGWLAALLTMSIS